MLKEIFNMKKTVLKLMSDWINSLFSTVFGTYLVLGTHVGGRIKSELTIAVKKVMT